MTLPVSHVWKKPVDLDAVRKQIAAFLIRSDEVGWIAGQAAAMADEIEALRSKLAAAESAIENAYLASSDEIEVLQSKLAAAESAIEDAYLASSTDYALHIARILDPVRAERFRLTGVSE